MRCQRSKSTVGAVMLAVLAACSTPSNAGNPDADGSTVPVRAGVVPRPAHVLMVIFENRSAGAVFGSPSAPYLNLLARTGAKFTDSHGVAHPSQPNYIALLSGSTQGVTDDSCPQSLAAPNLATQLLDSGRTFTGYSEGLPRPGFTGCTDDLYARKHNPWVDFTNVPASANQPLTAMPRDYDTLPTVSIITPNLCHDMHYCPILVGDIWARRHLSPYVQWARTHDSMLIITFDEDNGTAANRIPTIVIGPMVRRTAATQQIDHYNVLRTVEEMYGLAPLARARGAQPITGIWVAGSLTPH